MTAAQLKAIQAWTNIVTSIFTALAAAAVPVVVAIVGSSIQSTVQRQTVDRDYVQIALSVLREKDASPELKAWATDLLSARSPVPFGKTLRDKLDAGDVILPRVGLGAGGLGQGGLGGWGASGWGAGAWGDDGTIVVPDRKEWERVLREHPELLQRLFPTPTTLPPASR